MTQKVKFNIYGHTGKLENGMGLMLTGTYKQVSGWN